MIKFSLYIFLLLSLFVSNVLAKSEVQSPVQSFKYLTTYDGFDCNTIWTIHQDCTGFMWFGTKSGLYKYDGRTLNLVKKLFVGDKSNVTSIVENNKSNTLWLIVDNTLFSLDMKTEKIKQEKLPFTSDITCIYTDKDCRLWISSLTDGVYTFDNTDCMFRKFNNLPSITNKSIVEICQNSKGLLYFLTSDNEIVIYDIQKEESRIIRSLNLNSTTCYIDSNNRIWLGTWNGLFFWHEASGKFQKIDLGCYNQRQIFGITKILEKNSDELYISTDSGLFIYNVKDGSVVHYKANLFSKGFLNNNYINDLYLDNEKTLWIGTYFGGVNYMTESSKNFLIYDFINHKMEGHVVSSFTEDESGNVWIATDDGGLSFYNRITHEVTNYNSFELPHPYIDFFNIHALQQDGDNLYIGMSSVGMNIVNMKSKEIKKISIKGKSDCRLHGMSVLTLTKCKNNELAIGTTSGLDIYDTRSEKVEHVDAIPNKEIHRTIEDKNGNLWTCGPEIGVFKRTVDGLWIDFAKGNEQINRYKVTTVEEGNGRIYFGTKYQGIICYDPTTESYENRLENEFKSVIVTCMIYKGHFLWIGTSNGLYSYDFITKKTKHYSEAQGIKSKQIYNGILTKDGTIFLGTTNGLNGFKPENISANTDNNTQRTVFTKLKVNNEEVLTQNKNSILTNIISYTDEIILLHEQSNISIEFSQLSYTDWKDRVYKYRLSPVDENWDITDSNHLNFKQLPAGNYILTVLGKNDDGSWNEKGCSIKIKILPPWWKTWQMYIMYMFLILCCIVFLVFSFNKRQEIYMKEIDNRRKEDIYQSKMDFFTNVIHDIRTPLTLILAPLENLRSRKDTEFFKKELDMMNRNGERLLKNVNQLMDFQKMGKNDIDYSQKEIIDVIQRLSIMKKDFEGMAESKSIAINILTDIDIIQPALIEVNNELFDKIFTNLFSNALKFSTNMVNIRITKKSDSYNISVEDNGPGILKEVQERIFEPFFQIKANLPSDYIGTGIGLYIVKNAVDKIGGKLSVSSELGKGTIFSVSLPVDFNMMESYISKDKKNDIEDKCFNVTHKKEYNKQKWRIAVAEDNEDMRNLIVSILSPYYHVYSYSDGEKLLNDKDNNCFDLIISDIMMPFCNGHELCRIIKENNQTCNVPVVLLTAKIMESDEIEGLENGADAYIRKPFSKELLLACVKNLLRNRDRITATFIHNPDVCIGEIIQNDKDNEFVEKLNGIIEKNINNQNLSAQLVASELSMCRALFFSKMKTISGVSFTNYVRIIRLKKAIELMKTGDYSLLDISIKVGFSSLSYFSKSFKQQFNITPSEYIKKLYQKD